ncbi:hypothetical protein E2C01_088482 [Portunus trituberculatus]|uniref:Uncharacterized protein n=1 Tax=Portunus trituberculatus TaxID=210409 RepID=A0A5B7JGQ2_PORTR|nr:hypothetical protein [Portunus trituberculatus]
MGPSDSSWDALLHDKADALPQQSSLMRLPTELEDSAANVLQEDCNTIWAAQVSTIQASGLKGLVHHIIEDSVSLQASVIPMAGETGGREHRSRLHSGSGEAVGRAGPASVRHLFARRRLGGDCVCVCVCVCARARKCRSLNLCFHLSLCLYT